MKSIKAILFASPLLILFSCSEQYLLDIPQDYSRIVIEGWIRSDQPPYVVVSHNLKIGEGLFGDNNGYLTSKIISTAFVMIADDVGHKDTLKYSELMLSYLWDEKDSVNSLNHIVLEPGHKYFLTVQYNNQTYTAETYMEPSPSIDNIRYVVRKGEVGKEDQKIPLISFEKLTGSDHDYLFFLLDAGFDLVPFFKEPGGIFRGGNAWPASILNDSSLPAEVKDLSIDDGASVMKNSTWYDFSYGITVFMCSIPNEAFDFYKNLLAQFDNDGGAYSPTPASPQGNISGGAIGLFYASHVSAAQIRF